MRAAAPVRGGSCACGWSRFVLGLSVRLTRVIRHRRRGRGAALVAVALLSTSVGGVEASAAETSRGRSESHRRLERDRLRHDRRRRWKGQRGSLHVVRVRTGRRVQRRRRHHPALRALQLERSSATAGRHRRPPPQSPRMMSCSSISRRRRAGWTPRGRITRRDPRWAAEEQGIRYGEHAADRLIELREDDGRFAPVAFDVPPGPGVWRPTPPRLRRSSIRGCRSCGRCCSIRRASSGRVRLRR